MLSSIFGSSTASSLLSSSSAIKSKEKKEAKKSKSSLKKLETKVVTEKRKFAGKMIEVSKTVTVDHNTPAEESGLDAVLGAMNEGKINTLQKTSLEWDNLKTKLGVEGQLEKAGEEGYLDRQDFLARVDGRVFEGEKDKRNAQRAKRGR